MKNPIENYLQKHNITLKQLSQKCDVSVHILKKMIAGEKRIRADAYYKLCKFTKIKLDDLLGLTK